MGTKKLIIDGQIFQTEAKDRGMGRYSTRLLQALVSHQHAYHDIEIVLTQSLPVPDALSQQLADAFKGIKLLHLKLATTKSATLEGAIKHNQGVLADYVKKQTEKGFEVDYLIPSLFQEPVVAVFPDNVGKLLVFYDLIPFLYHRRYRPVMNFDNYLKRFKYLFEADMVFTISQTVADDLHTYLGIPREKLVRIDGAAIRSEKTPEKPPVEIPAQFILMPTSDDPRKNNLRAVLGFEEFRSRDHADLKLVITSKIHRRERDYLELFSKNLIFTGNLPEEQLEWLYEHCQAVLFTPEYEGLGLPILEAVEFGKSVACSSISVFKEIAEDSFAYCDHENSTSIADGLARALDSEPDKQAYKRVAEYYTWPKTAERLLAAARRRTPPTPKPKPRLAIFTPDISQASTAARLTAETHASLSEDFDIDYFMDKSVSKSVVRPNFLRFITSVHEAESFGVSSYANYDAVIYHIGATGHEQAIKNALYLPGFMVLHSDDLSQAYHLLAKNGLMSADRLKLEARLSELAKDTRYLTSLASRQLGALSLSDPTQETLRALIPTHRSVIHTGLPVPEPSPTEAVVESPQHQVIAILGRSGSRHDVELAESVAAEPSIHGRLILFIDLDKGEPENIERLSSHEYVSVLGDPTDFELRTALRKVGVLINLGDAGETALTVAECAAQGISVLHSLEALDKLPRLMKNPGTASSKSASGTDLGRRQYVDALRGLVAHRLPTDDPAAKLANELKAGRIKSARQYTKYIGETA